MKQYVVVLIDSDEESVVGTYNTLEEAKNHLRSVRYYPEYKRTCEALELSNDGMSGTGQDCSGRFEYNIKIA